MTQDKKWLREEWNVIKETADFWISRVVKNGDGSALMRNPKLAEEVLKSVVKNSTKPVTLKIKFILMI